MPHVTTPKDHLTAHASKGTLVTDTTVLVKMKGPFFSSFFITAITLRSKIKNQFPLRNEQIVVTVFFEITHKFRQQ